MNLNQYQIEACSTAIYQGVGSNLVYPALGLVGEAGEIANKVKKPIRSRGNNTVFTKEEKEELAKELGDVLWYVAVLSTELGYKLEDVASINIEKLKSRQLRGVIEGHGDNR